MGFLILNNFKTKTMATIDKNFNVLTEKILNDGKTYIDRRRDTTRLQIPHHIFEYNLSDGFPALTSKKLYFKGVIAELISFLRGDNNIKYMLDNKCPIWNDDAYNWYVKKIEKILPIVQPNLCRIDESGNRRLFTLEEFVKTIKSAPDLSYIEMQYSSSGYILGDVGQNYSVQYRKYNGHVDQIFKLIMDMKKDIMGSRLIVEAWNPSELDDTALPPCHKGYQIVGVPFSREERQEIFGEVVEFMSDDHLTKKGVPKFGFMLVWDQRSVDTFLGLPFNIASYAVLSHIFEKITKHKALSIIGSLKCVHFYDNQLESARELLTRDTDIHENCTLEILGDWGEINTVKDLNYIFDNMKISDFKLNGYTSHESMSVKMLAPIKL